MCLTGVRAFIKQRLHCDFLVISLTCIESKLSVLKMNQDYATNTTFHKQLLILQYTSVYQYISDYTNISMYSADVSQTVSQALSHHDTARLRKCAGTAGKWLKVMHGESRPFKGF